jgi:hypothetical protein
MTKHVRVLTVLLLCPLSAAEAEMNVKKDGVRVSVTTLVDRVVFCIFASGDLRISSEYGIEFKADRQNVRSWLERLPKVVMGPPYYFDLPLRIELKTREGAQQRRIRLNLGTCSDGKGCVPVNLEVNAPVATPDLVAADCSK